jgi:hypothetical protein
MTGAPDLYLLTATEAAAMLNVDVKTFRRMAAPFILAGRSRRYTRALLQSWLERSVVQCLPNEPPRGKRKPGKSPGKNTLLPGRVPPTGKSPSGSTIIEFEKAVGLRTD